MSQNELITGWVYKKGELIRQRIYNRNMILAMILSLVISLILLWPLLSWNHPLKGKIGDWILIIVFILFTVVIKFLLKIFSGTVFSVYKKIFGVKEEEIIFTNYKITSTNKTWILNDESNQLTNVMFSADNKSPELTFKGTANRPGKPSTTYSIDIPVPPNEKVNAEKIRSYFQQKLQDQLPKSTDSPELIIDK